ncbi:hypothetical protein [Yoonia sp. R2-816]|uniref:hypothetical protein n=1 Tax=Yoonia sp. R2-816 TaxID=3342638 RepID=UPI00372D50CD
MESRFTVFRPFAVKNDLDQTVAALFLTVWRAEVFAAKHVRSGHATGIEDYWKMYVRRSWR